MGDDPFDTILHHEDSLYREAFALGQHDGAHTGLVEGRLFGLEKGFDKFLAMGRLHGRALVWASRLPPSTADTGANGNGTNEGNSAAAIQAADPPAAATTQTLPSLRTHGRLDRHVRTLLALTDPATLAPANTDDAVAAFDDRVRRAVVKARIVAHIVGEDAGVSAPVAPTHDGTGSDANARDVAATAGDGEGNIEDLDVRHVRR